MDSSEPRASSLRARLQTWLGTSTAHGVYRRCLASVSVDDLAASIGVAFDGTQMTGVTRTLRKWVHHSASYQWLVRDPEPDTVVIDLRETVTLGPFLSLIAVLFDHLEQAYHGSTAEELRSRLQAFESIASESVVVQGLLSVLTPPPSGDETK